MFSMFVVTLAASYLIFYSTEKNRPDAAFDFIPA